MYLTPNGGNLIDLHVYVDGSATLPSGGLYDFVYRPEDPPLELPFTYPPFAAMLFYPLHLLPFGMVALCWLLGIVAALYGSVVLSLRLIAPEVAGWRAAAAITAVAMWLEPLRSSFELGQVGVVLMLMVLAAVYTSRSWLSGLLVGLAAGIKLTPAVAGLYFLGTRRITAVVVSAIVFVGTVAVSALVVGDQAIRYFTDLLRDTSRVGSVGDVANQTLRGGVSRILGYDAGYGPLVLVIVALVAAAAWLAWRAVGAHGEDRLGLLLVVQLFGLLVSPMSWTHHWVWLVPLIMWLLLGPAARDPGMRTGARWLAAVWLAVTLVGVPWLLRLAQPNYSDISRPWYLAWAGLVYIVCAVATLIWMATTRRSAPTS